MPDNNIFDIYALRSKLESTEGDDAAPDSTNAIQVINGSAQIESDQVTRQISQPHLGSRPFISTNVRWNANYGVELVGAATQGEAAPIDTELQNSAHARTLVTGPPDLARYNPITNGIVSATKEFYRNGELKKAVGCRSVPTGMSFGIDVIPLMNITSTGFVVPTTEVAVPSDDLSDFQVPLVGSTESLSVTLDGFEVSAVTLDISFANNLFLQRHTVAGSAKLTQRNVTGTLQLFRPSYSEKNIRNLVSSNALVPLVLTQTLSGSEAKAVKLTMAAVQLSEPEDVDIGGIAGWNLPFTIKPLSGNDDYVLEFGA